MDLLTLASAFIIGLFGGAHCLGMCGGILGALSTAVDAEQPRRRTLLLAAYNLGRIGSYVLIAVVFFLLIGVPAHYLSLGFMRILAGLLVIAMGLYLADWWRGLVYLEKAGLLLWRRIQPLSQSLLPVHSLGQALALGFIWGWLPCGLIYSALVYSATADTAYGAALIMLSFGLGTLPVMMLGGLFAEGLLSVIRHRRMRRLMGGLLVLFGIWTLTSSLLQHRPEASHTVPATLESSLLDSGDYRH